MLRKFLPLLLLAAVVLPARLAAKSDTITMYPGETIYARFENTGKKIRLVNAGKEKDGHAQVIFTVMRDPVSLGVVLHVQNKFTQDFDYELVVRSKRIDRDAHIDVSTVVGGKVSFEALPALTEELLISGYRLEH